MNNSVIIDSRLKSKIEELMDSSPDENTPCYSVRFKDLDDAFWFGDKIKLQEFLHNQAVERFYDKELRKGYFDYVNEHEETFRYHIVSKRGTLTLLNEEFVA
jgi:hypothetical protein